MTGLTAMLCDPAMITALALVERGTAKPACRFDVDWSLGPGIRLDHLAGLRALERIVGGKAVIEAREGRAREAWCTILTGLRLARAAQQEPYLVSHLVLIAQTSIILQAAAQLQGQAPPEPSTSQALAEALDALARPDTMAICVDADRLLLGEWVFSREHRHEFPNVVGAPNCGRERMALRLYASPLAFPLWQWDHTWYLQVMGDAAGVMSRPDDLAEGKLGDRLVEAVPRLCLGTRLLVPALGRARVKDVEHLARLRLARIALALLSTRPEDGSFPVDLAAVAAAGVDITDPFTGKPLVYRRIEGGFVLYSLGPDQRDDGGTPRPRGSLAQAQSEEGWDVVWSFPPTALRGEP